ncbi:ABC transporter permease [Pseudonocardia sp. KRD-184]|uniref:Transport permease protein n=1 Tax=Pseudonocardia oceani TaxID=2792013 RepID=A0ABS6U4U0_9PSEU|nr:ABC transporter permease [Pseudonocardia oceani]MBW0093603.1 ABC transporter permease [Pseudonocardia oceani]MBW0100256.1 ABC transporter permease [Pseudonocardia oceani]MBW0113012.1 ABC transporter permease [Pseudonocardia oceani]MBW0125862.1 ABC transporter permease [Pseudonocardia oceani]MBW0127174.1 ABC transporter permease [Pseudonocardia oceani]
MTALLARTELRLFLRDPATTLFGILLPAAVLAGLGSIPALREPAEVFGGLRFTEYFAPSLLAVSIAVLGLQTLPVGLATYREKGVLRRLSTTPVRPQAVIVAQLLINLVTAAAGSLLMVAVAVGVFDVPAPRHPLGFAAAFVVGTSAVFALGLVVAGVAPRARTAAAIGTVLFMLTQFFAGVYLPKFLLPETVVAIGSFVPPGITAFQDAWTGAGPQPVQLLVMALVAVAATAVAARFFRWE